MNGLFVDLGAGCWRLNVFPLLSSYQMSKRKNAIFTPKAFDVLDFELVSIVSKQITSNIKITNA